MFGPWGIVIGPVLMILGTTTLEFSLAAYNDAEPGPPPTPTPTPTSAAQ